MTFSARPPRSAARRIGASPWNEVPQARYILTWFCSFVLLLTRTLVVAPSNNARQTPVSTKRSLNEHARKNCGWRSAKVLWRSGGQRKHGEKRRHQARARGNYHRLDTCAQSVSRVCKVARWLLARAQIVSRTVRNVFVPESGKHCTSRAQLGRKEGAKDCSGSRSAREHWPRGQAFV